MTGVTKVMCCFPNLTVHDWAKTTVSNTIKYGENTPWACLRNWLDFESCDLIFKVTVSQKVTNQKPFLCTQYSPSFYSDLVKLFWGHQGYQLCQIVVSGSRDIFITNRDSNFKYSMATLLGMLCKTCVWGSHLGHLDHRSHESHLLFHESCIHDWLIG